MKESKLNVYIGGIICEWWTGIVWIRTGIVEHGCEPPGALE
jgi:hypothetical protein